MYFNNDYNVDVGAQRLFIWFSFFHYIIWYVIGIVSFCSPAFAHHSCRICNKIIIIAVRINLKVSIIMAGREEPHRQIVQMESLLYVYIIMYTRSLIFVHLAVKYKHPLQRRLDTRHHIRCKIPKECNYFSRRVKKVQGE